MTTVSTGLSLASTYPGPGTSRFVGFVSIIFVLLSSLLTLLPRNKLIQVQQQPRRSFVFANSVELLQECYHLCWISFADGKLF